MCVSVLVLIKLGPMEFSARSVSEAHYERLIVLKLSSQLLSGNKAPYFLHLFVLTNEIFKEGGVRTLLCLVCCILVLRQKSSSY